MGFECSVHNVKFDTPEQYYQHEREVAHEQILSSAECAGCKKVFGPITIKAILPAGKLQNPVKCPECQAKEDELTIERLKAEGKIK